MFIFLGLMPKSQDSEEELPLQWGRGAMLVACSWNLHAGWKHRHLLFYHQLALMGSGQFRKRQDFYNFQDKTAQSCPKTSSNNGFRGQDLK